MRSDIWLFVNLILIENKGFKFTGSARSGNEGVIWKAKKFINL